MRRTVLAVAVASLLAALGACSKKDKDIDPPAQLADFPATLRVQRAWDASVGGKGEKLRLGLGLAVNEGRVFAAGHGGEVAAWELLTGKKLWDTRTKAPLSGGTGAGEGLVVVGTSEGALIALNSRDGAERWRAKVNGEVLSAPEVSPRAVFVRTVDGKLHALAPDTGKELWQYEQQTPRLTLRGTAKPVVVGDAVICGFDNGKVVALNVPDGALLWESTVASAHGRTELERLVDIDSAVEVVQGNVYTVGFQGRVAMLALDSGQIWWAQDASSYRGLAADIDNVYVSTADGEVVALKRATGVELWRQKGLAHRGLSAPVVLDNSTVAVADYKGYVHWLDKSTGAFAGRAEAGGERVSNPPVAIGNRVLVINDEGRVTAFNTTPIALASAAKSSKQKAAPAAPSGEESERLETGVPPSLQRRGPPSPSEPIERPPVSEPAPSQPPAAEPPAPATQPPASEPPASEPAPAPPQ
jgi:outer membrane protein assembly factor BamB